MPDMEFRRLEEDEAELASALAASLAGVEDVKFEGWGLGRDGAVPLGCEPWGMLIRGALAGVLWLMPAHGGTVEIRALVLPRKRWGAGLARWMLERVAEPARAGGGTALSVTLNGGSAALGEILEEAGFSGPGPEEAAYPAGAWMRRLDVSVAR